MKQKILSILTALALCLTLLPTAALAEDIPDDHKFTLDFTGECYTAHKQTVSLKDHLPEDAIVTGFASTSATVVASFSYTYTSSENANVEGAYFTYTTREQEEPASGSFIVTVSTSNHDNYVFTINITLTGKYLVTLSAIPQNALYDGQPHDGYSNLKGTLTSGAAYAGPYVFSYAKEDGTSLSGAPSEIGDYTVTISISDNNTNYKHKEVLTLAFSIIENAEAQYQTEANGAWLNGTFEQALANVYEGGTIKLLKDVVLTQTAALAKKMTITSANTSAPCTITSNTNEHGYLLNITGEVKLENVIVDGGSKSSITAKRAAISVNGGKLALGSGVVIQNNKNVTKDGVGGGVCVISGELYLDGATITGNDGYFGGGVGMVGGTFYAKSGTITGNTARMGGGISVWELRAADEQYNTYGTLHLSGTVAVTGNRAIIYAGGIQYSNAGKIYLSGSPTINQNTSNEETNGGIYLDGNSSDGFAIVKVNEKLSNAANVSFYSWKGSAGFVLAEPIDNYTITADDVGAMHYDGNFGIKLTDDNKAVLTNVGVYQITFDANGGSVKTETAKTAEGKLAALPTPTRSGYTFVGWYTEAEGGTKITTETVFRENTTVYAHWTYAPVYIPVAPTTFPIIVTGGVNGTVTADRKSAAAGTTVTITVTPDSGCASGSLTVLDKNGNSIPLTDRGNGQYTFIMPAGQVTVTAVFNPLRQFVDVPAGMYCYDAVQWAVGRGITSGVDDSHFGPDLSCTRAQLVTFLWRAAGCPMVDYAMNFADVDENAYYAEAVRWAASLGIVDGYGSGLFDANDAITREQMAVILYRFAQTAGMDTAQGGMSVREYKDYDSISDYALAAMQWAVNAGIMQGADGSLMPGQPCTRGQIVTMLHRLLVQ